MEQLLGMTEALYSAANPKTSRDTGKPAQKRYAYRA